MYKELLIKLVSIIFMLLSYSCTKEDTTLCSEGLRINFSYTLNKLGVDLLASEVNSMCIFFFDSKGVLIDIRNVGVNDIKNGYIYVYLATGSYTAVAWAGSSSDIFAGGYQAAEVMDDINHIFRIVQVGRTTLTNFRMMLGYENLTSVDGTIIPKVSDFTDSYCAFAENIGVTGKQDQAVSLNLIKQTNILKVKVSGLQYLSGYSYSKGASNVQPLKVYAEGHNYLYRYNNRIDPKARVMRYERPYKTLSPTSMEVDIKVLRLVIGNSVYLTVRNPLSGQDMIPPLDVVETFRKVKDSSGKSLFVSQEDFDREYEYPIEVSIGLDLRVTVRVKGFVLENISADVSKN